MTPIIVAKNAGKRFGGQTNGVTAIENITINIAEGEFVSLLGPSGCGKSTFLRCLAGLERVTSGTILIDGKIINGPPHRLGIAFQRDALLDWLNVLDNVLLPADFSGLPKRDFAERASQLLKMAGLSAFERAYPRALSGGMRQRVAMCRSLLMEPRLLLMDEPFGAVDALTRDQLNIDLLLLWRQRRMTVVFVTHSISEAIFLSSRIVVFSPQPGKVIDEIAVDLPPDRKLAIRETEEFGRYARHVRGLFEIMGLLRD